MTRKSLTQSSTTESVPAWVSIRSLGYKPALFLASKDKQQGVVLLVSPQDPNLKGIAWWDGDWEDAAKLRAQIKWSRSPLTLHSWAALHPVAKSFDPLLHLLLTEVRRTAN
jgi:hypothetical protein